jgi:hypothetical protein
VLDEAAERFLPTLLHAETLETATLDTDRLRH